MKFKYTFVTIIIILLGGFSWSYGSDSDYPTPRKIDIESDNSRGDGDCTSCAENYAPEFLGAACCDQASAFYSCTELEGSYNWNCSGCECASPSDDNFVSMYGCIEPLAANFDEAAVYSYGVCWYPDLKAVGGITEISLDWEPYGTICEVSDACNYNLSSLSGCVYAEVNEDCDGNCIVDIDCAGECGGSAVVDECGVCNGDGIPVGDCDCAGNVDDCLGECGGDAEYDGCGICDNDSSNDCFLECDGEFDGCGMCTGGTTGLDYNYAMDCLGDCPGALGYTDAQEDVCGVCEGPGDIYGCGCAEITAGDCNCAGQVDDCFGVCGGSAVEDECGVCDGGGKAECALDEKEVCDLEECTIYYNVYKTEEGVAGIEIISENMTGTAFTDPASEYINTFFYYVAYIDAWGNESSLSDAADAAYDDGAYCSNDNQCEAEACDACGECAGNNTDCRPDSAVCTLDDECEADYCDECGECNGNNPVSCFPNGYPDCDLDNECEADYCDECGECNGNNPVSCFPDDYECYLNNQCEADVCDACGDCGFDNPVFCHSNGSDCDFDDECVALDCDECGECNGDGPGDYSCEEIPEGFSYNQSAFQAFYNVGNAFDALGIALEEDKDWVGAFKGDICVGSTKWAGVHKQIPVMGDDGYGYTDGYMNVGEIPTFIVFDASAAIDASPDSMFTVFPYNVEGSLAYSLNNWVNMELLPEFSHFERQLDVGVNLISFYVLPLEPTTIEEVFESCAGSIDYLITEGSAAIYDLDDGWIGSLQYIDPHKAYWVVDNSACNLSLVGFNYNPDLEYTLHPGANLISYPAQGCADIEASLIPFGDYFYAVFGDGNAAVNTINGGWGGSLTEFCGGDGYWTILNDDISNFSYNMDDGIGRTIDVYSETMPTFGEFKVRQSTEQAFYFVDEITLLDGHVEIGDWLLSYNGDVLTGIRQWQGMMIDIPTMGASDDVLTTGYFVKGDIPTFKLLKQSTGEFLALDGEIAEWSSNGVFTLSGLSEIESAPKQISLDSAYPNPFNPTTTISFGLAEDTEVSINVYNIQGSVVETLASQYMEAGYHSVVWNADQHSSGIYFVKMLTSPSTSGITGENGTVNIQKLMLIK